MPCNTWIDKIARMKTQIEKELAEYRLAAEQKEEAFLFSKAAFSKDHHRPGEAENDHRMPYKRDVDRIVHSKAYARYVDKTQVVYLVDNDHITHRSLHVQLVSNFARGIAEILRLNLDLVEAIALGHDVGHPPFGHEGEGYLSALSTEYDNGPFCHPLQSCRLLSEIEPLNLGEAVYDGFLCHDGGMSTPAFTPAFGKSWKKHKEEKEEKQAHPEANIMPGTLEGCLVKLCDTMSYLGRDIEDAISIGILDRDNIPKTHLGITNREILSTLAADIIHHSYNKAYIAISEKSYEALQIIRQFNFKHIYTHPKLKVESSKIKIGYRILFCWLLEDMKEDLNQSYLWEHFLHKRSEKYLLSTTPVQMVVDYIAGMTDNFFVKTLEKIFVPSKIHLEF